MTWKLETPSESQSRGGHGGCYKARDAISSSKWGCYSTKASVLYADSESDAALPLPSGLAASSLQQAPPAPRPASRHHSIPRLRQLHQLELARRRDRGRGRTVAAATAAAAPRRRASRTQDSRRDEGPSRPQPLQGHHRGRELGPGTADRVC